MLVWIRVAAEKRKVYQSGSTEFGIWIWSAGARGTWERIPGLSPELFKTSFCWMNGLQNVECATKPVCVCARVRTHTHTHTHMGRGWRADNSNTGNRIPHRKKLPCLA